MKYKKYILGILTCSIMLILLFPNVTAKIDRNSTVVNLQQTSTLAPVIYFDLSGINSTHNITYVTVYESDMSQNLSSADIYVNNVAQNGSFSFVDYSTITPPISPTNIEAISSGGENTYSDDIDIGEEFEEDQHNDIKAEGLNTLGLSSRGAILFCNNQECWSPGIIPLARKSSSTDIQNPPNLEVVDNTGPLIVFNLTKIACCGDVYFQVSDSDSGVVSVETLFSNNILIVNATNGGSVTTRVGVNFGEFDITSICINNPCEPCETCETCPTIPDTFPTNFSVFSIIPILIGIVCIVVLRKRKLKK